MSFKNNTFYHSIKGHITLLNSSHNSKLNSSLLDILNSIPVFNCKAKGNKKMNKKNPDEGYQWTLKGKERCSFF